MASSLLLSVIRHLARWAWDAGAACGRFCLSTAAGAAFYASWPARAAMDCSISLARRTKKAVYSLRKLFASPDFKKYRIDKLVRILWLVLQRWVGFPLQVMQLVFEMFQVADEGDHEEANDDQGVGEGNHEREGDEEGSE